MNKKVLYRSLVLATGIVALWQVGAKAEVWSGPPPGCYNPTPEGCNTDGVIWNRSDATFDNAPQLPGNYNIAGKAKIGGDLILSNTKAIRVDSIGTTRLNIGNWGSSPQRGLNVAIYGTLQVLQPGGSGTLATVSTTQLCLTNDCRTTWPTIGGGGTVTSVGSGNGLTGGPISGSGSLAIISCASGQILKAGAGGVWGCAADDSGAGGGGDVTDVLEGDGITVTNPGGPQPTVKLKSSDCMNGQIRKWNGTNWVCVSDVVGQVVAGTGVIVSGVAPSQTVSVDDTRYVNVTGDTMTGGLSISAPGMSSAFWVENAYAGAGFSQAGYFKANNLLGIGVEAQGGLYGVSGRGMTNNGAVGVFGQDMTGTGFGGQFTNSASVNTVWLGGSTNALTVAGLSQFNGNVSIGTGAAPIRSLCLNGGCVQSLPTSTNTFVSKILPDTKSAQFTVSNGSNPAMLINQLTPGSVALQVASKQVNGGTAVDATGAVAVKGTAFPAATIDKYGGLFQDNSTSKRAQLGEVNYAGYFRNINLVGGGDVNAVKFGTASEAIKVEKGDSIFNGKVHAINPNAVSISHEAHYFGSSSLGSLQVGYQNDGGVYSDVNQAVRVNASGAANGAGQFINWVGGGEPSINSMVYLAQGSTAIRAEGSVVFNNEFRVPNNTWGDGTAAGFTKTGPDGKVWNAWGAGGFGVNGKCWSQTSINNAWLLCPAGTYVAGVHHNTVDQMNVMCCEL